MNKSNKESMLAYNISIKYLAARARSMKEVRDNLFNKKISSETILKTIEVLEEESLIDDRIFAKEFVATREKVRPKSKFALRYELRKKGISDSIIEYALKDIDENKSALAAVKPKLSIWITLDIKIMQKKMMNFLKNRGFNWETSLYVFNKTINDMGNHEGN
jgi:regulatory protein